MHTDTDNNAEATTMTPEELVHTNGTRWAMGRSFDRLFGRGSRVRPGLRQRVASGMRTGKLVAVGMLLVVLLVGWWASTSGWFTVRMVEVEDNQVVSRADVLALANLTGLSLWSVDTAKVASTLAQHPYIETAQVTLRIPNTVIVQLREHRPQVSWHNGSQHYLVDSQGVILAQTQTAPVSSTLVIADRSNLPRAVGTHVDLRAVRLAQALAVRLPHETGLHIASFSWDAVRGISTTTADERLIVWGTGDRLDAGLQLIAALQREAHPYRLLDLRGRTPMARLDLPEAMLQPALVEIGQANEP